MLQCQIDLPLSNYDKSDLRFEAVLTENRVGLEGRLANN